MNKKKLLSTFVFATSALFAVGFVQLTKVSNTSNTISQYNTNLNANATTASSGLKNLAKEEQNSQISIPQNYYQQDSFKNYSNDNGPILLFDNARSFGATDWYGNPAWYITLNSTNKNNDGYYSSYWFSTSTNSSIDFSKAGTKVVDWAYNHKTDNLYVLTDKSYLIIVSSKTGTIVSTNAISHDVNKIQIIDFNDTVYLWNSKTQKPTIYSIEPQTGELNTTSISSSSLLKSKYLFAIIPLDINYSIAVTSDSQVSDSNTTVNLTLTFVDDNLSSINDGKQQSVQLASAKASNIYINSFKRNSDYVVFIKNKIYSVSLNKSLMSSSSFTDLTDGTKNKQANNFSLSDGVNSAFIDSNNQIYFKTSNSKNINTLSISNGFTNIQINTGNINTAFKNDDSAKPAQIFAVPLENNNDIISRNYTGYVLSPNDFTGTGFISGNLLTTRYTTPGSSPLFTISGSTSVVPSAVNSTNIASANSSFSNVTFEINNATLIADDISGTLFVRLPYTITGAWYGNGSSTVLSRGYLIGKFSSFQNIQTATTWATDLPTDLKKLEPKQISLDLLKKYETSIINIPQSILSLTDNQLNINFVIQQTNSSSGKITLLATISYKNAYGSIVNYSMLGGKEYTVKKEAAQYDFAFAGQNTPQDKSKVYKTNSNISDLISQAQTAVKDSGQSDFFQVDISTLTSNDPVFATYANVLPSLWNSDVINTNFIVTHDKYPSDPTITLIPDDNSGSIVIIVQYNNLASNTPSKFAIKYTGITKYSNSSLKFQGTAMTITKANGSLVFPEDKNILDITKVSGFSDYGTKLVSSLDANSLSTLYSSPLIDSMGFEPTVTFATSEDANSQSGFSTYDQEYGSFLLKIDFSNSKSKYLKDSTGNFIPFSQTSFGDQMGFKNGVIYQRYGGLLPIGSTYNISLDKTGANYKSLIANNNVNASVSSNQLMSILTINGYDSSKGDTIQILDFRWNGEILQFTLHAQSKTYESINTTQTFDVSWSPKFASVRNMSLSVAVVTSIVGITLVSLGVSIYIIRRNKIRKLLK